ncbi:ferritin [Clostridium acidisoli DSM 12555]|uniref:Ferritin n=1 Tax=Clostridium acidisoli DSM 12555 TaxID=1121291 RepID=A0A1W1XRV5_9CLOT|nr:ferritin [Clostridium acidisoli]SMC26271.1 ferritin [Clostridium acidisoli DSM 12555]
MISEQLLSALNDQLNYEYYSAHIYLAMQAYCASEDLDGFANFFKVQVDEERFHASKFFDYIIDMNFNVEITGFDNPTTKFDSMIDVFRSTLEHEKHVTERIYKLMDIATNEREHATISFLKWFIDEQIEEEKTITAILKRLERIGDDKAALYILDSELMQRVFTPPATV